MKLSVLLIGKVQNIAIYVKLYFDMIHSGSVIINTFAGFVFGY